MKLKCPTTLINSFFLKMRDKIIFGKFAFYVFMLYIKGKFKNKIK